MPFCTRTPLQLDDDRAGHQNPTASHNGRLPTGTVRHPGPLHRHRAKLQPGQPARRRPGADRRHRGLRWRVTAPSGSPLTGRDELQDVAEKQLSTFAPSNFSVGICSPC